MVSIEHSRVLHLYARKLCGIVEIKASWKLVFFFPDFIYGRYILYSCKGHAQDKGWPCGRKTFLSRPREIVKTYIKKKKIAIFRGNKNKQKLVQYKKKKKWDIFSYLVFFSPCREGSVSIKKIISPNFNYFYFFHTCTVKKYF